MFLDTFLAEDAYLALSKVQGGVGVGAVSGQTFWVDSSDTYAADAVGRGTFKAPFATIEFGIGQCVANRGDVLLVKPNHTEDLTTASGILLDVDGVTIRGLGWTTFSPKITISHADAYIDITANGTGIFGIQIETNIAGPIGKLIHVNGANGVRLGGLTFRLGGATYYVTNGVVFDTCEDGEISGCRFYWSTAGTASERAIHLTAEERTRITNCFIIGDFTVACIAGTSTVLECGFNRLVNLQAIADNDGIINVTGDTCGVIHDNVGFHGRGADPDDLDFCIAPDLCGACENYFTNLAGESGGIAPPDRSD